MKIDKEDVVVGNIIEGIDGEEIIVGGSNLGVD